MFLLKSTSNFLLPEISNYCASSTSEKKNKKKKIEKGIVLLYWNSGGRCEDIISILPNPVSFMTLS